MASVCKISYNFHAISTASSSLIDKMAQISAIQINPFSKPRVPTGGRRSWSGEFLNLLGLTWISLSFIS